MTSIAIIPARYASTRLPGKPLVDIMGKPLLQRVWENVIQAESLSDVIIAVDDERVADLCRAIGAKYAMTPPELPSGSDRIAFAYDSLACKADIVLNIQGDEPFLSGEVIDSLVLNFSGSGADTGTLIKSITSDSDLFDQGVVKVVMDNNNFALYFSRNTIPYVRDTQPDNWLERNTFYKHIGVYAYRIETLQQFIKLPIASLEEAEKLEQLRLLQNGYKMLCVETDADLIGIDTPEDVEHALQRISGLK